MQIVNEGYQVFDKTTGASLLGPSGIQTIWGGFGGVCQNNGSGDPIVLYDQLANRWIISQFAGVSVPTDECIAVSTTSDATGAYHRYAFHLGSNFFDYPKLSVWPDGYYMSMNVFNSSGTAYLGPQPFAFDRAKMLARLAGHFRDHRHHRRSVGRNLSAGGSRRFDSAAAGRAGDIRGMARNRQLSDLPFPRGFRDAGEFDVHVIRELRPRRDSSCLCATTRNCVPQSGTTTRLDAIGDRLMFRLAYRNFGTHESVVGNYTVSSGGVAGVRWFEIRNVTNGPVTRSSAKHLST